MIRKLPCVRESGPTVLSGYVPELPSILVTGGSADQLTARAAEAIKIYWEVLQADHSNI